MKRTLAILRDHERARQGMARVEHCCALLISELRALKPYQKQITVLRYGAPCIDEAIPIIAALRGAAHKFIRRFDGRAKKHRRAGHAAASSPKARKEHHAR